MDSMTTEEKTMGSNGKIALPKDAEGREIPLDTRKIFDKEGNEWHVVRVEYNPRAHGWRFVVSKDGLRRFLYEGYAHLKKPLPSDSWEKLLDDLKNVSKATNRSLGATCCIWFNDGKGCVDCPANEVNDETCGSQFVNDIAARIRKLRGED